MKESSPSFYHLLPDALPFEFDFYDSGNIKSSELAFDEFSSDLSGIAFKLSGDLNAWMILIIDQASDLSLYA
ncbi:MAG: hypothetical protein HYX41_03670, partial [Bdellovibrio sp.]|nr:hypothetical protein [Bdellovibrio sp.]